MDTPVTTDNELLARKRAALRAKHAAALVTLMTEREDLRGVHAFADYVDDAVRWSA
jgi:hypothetical protein